MIHRNCVAQCGGTHTPYGVDVVYGPHVFDACWYWIAAHCGPRHEGNEWCWSGLSSSGIAAGYCRFYFKDERNALAFALRWSGAAAGDFQDYKAAYVDTSKHK